MILKKADLRRRSFVATSLATGIVIAIGVISSETLRVQLVGRPIIMQRLRAGLVAPKQREDAIARLFLESGCEVVRQQVSKHDNNVVCTLRGQTSETIDVGGHFDFVEEGKGIVDDWSGTSLLPSLYQSLKGQESTRHTFRFIAFAEEERGLIGSSRYVKEMSADERLNTEAFVNLECLGLTPPKVWVHRSTPMLVLRLLDVARSVHIPLAEVDVERVGDDDTHPFQAKKIPVISVHSLTQDTWRAIHSPRDNVSAVHEDDYYDAYRLIAFYLAYLDMKLGSQDDTVKAVKSK